jgi:hypothetical protein
MPSMGSPPAPAAHAGYNLRPDSSAGVWSGLPATPGVGATGAAANAAASASAVRVSRSQVRPVSLAQVEAARLSAAGAALGGYAPHPGSLNGPGRGGVPGGEGAGLMNHVGSPDGSKPTSPIASYSGLGFSSY